MSRRMNEREDVETLEEVFERLSVPSWIRPAFTEAIAAHVEAVRVSERVRLAGEVEALADDLAVVLRQNHYWTPDGSRVDWERMARAAISALVPVPGVRLTEEE